MNILENCRVRRPKEHDDFLHQLIKKDKIFSSYKNALVFSASVGYRFSQRIPFEESSEPIRISIFDTDTDRPFMYALALADSKDIDLMKEDKFLEVVKIFEEYANAGLHYLKDRYDPESHVQNIEALVYSEKSAEDESLIDLLTL